MGHKIYHVGHHILPRLQPLAPEPSVVQQIGAQLLRHLAPVRQPRLSRLLYLKPHPVRDLPVKFLCQRMVVVPLFQIIGNNLKGVAPADAAVWIALLPAVHGSDLRHTSLRCLGGRLLPDPFRVDRIAVHQIHGRADVCLAVPGVTGLLPGGAVRGNINEISLHAPEGVAKQLVYFRHPAGKLPGGKHIGVDGHRLEVRRINIKIRLHQHIPESHVSLGGMVKISSLPAPVDNLLLRAHLGRLEIFNRKIPVAVQRLPMGQGNGLPGFRLQIQPHIPHQILSEIQHLFAFRRDDQLRRKDLLRQNRHRVHADQIVVSEILPLHAVVCHGLRPRRVILLPGHQVISTQRAVVAGFPGLIGNKHRLPVHFHLAEQRHIRPVDIFILIVSHGTPMPSVPQCNHDLIFPDL